MDAATVPLPDLSSDRNLFEPSTSTETPLLSSGPKSEKWHRTPRARGRQPKDPLAQTVRFDCKDADDMENSLRDYLQSPTAPAEHATVEFHFPVTSAFMVYTKDFKKDSQPITKGGDVYNALRRTAVSVIDVLTTPGDPKEQMRRQKSVAKICVETIQKADGYRYSFHNNWLSREDEASRFSYFCNDSTLNKGRAANEGAGTSGKEKRKPVYDCQGLVAVKFSVTKQNLEVHYRHVPVHKTYEERAPPPRRDSKRRRLMELFDPESLTALRQPNKRPRRKVEENDASSGRGKQRATESPSARPNTAPMDLSQDREGSLQPLIDFLGSTENMERNSQNRGVVQGMTNDAGNRPQSTSEPPTSLADKTHEPTTETLTSASAGKGKKNPVPPNIPGAMFGSMRSGDITWGGRRKQKEKQTPKQVSKKKGPITSTNTDAASEAPAVATSGTTISAQDTMSELESLKQSLMKAEERIRRLEAEKTQNVNHYPAYMYPPPHGYPYAYPPPPPPHLYPYPAPPQQAAVQQPQQQTQQPSLAQSATSQSQIQALSHSETPQRNAPGVPKPRSPPKSSSGARGRRPFVQYTPRDVTIAAENDAGRSAIPQRQPNMRYVTFDEEGNRNTSSRNEERDATPNTIPSKFL